MHEIYLRPKRLYVARRIPKVTAQPMTFQFLTHFWQLINAINQWPITLQRPIKIQEKRILNHGIKTYNSSHHRTLTHSKHTHVENATITLTLGLSSPSMDFQVPPKAYKRGSLAPFQGMRNLPKLHTSSPITVFPSPSLKKSYNKHHKVIEGDPWGPFPKAIFLFLHSLDEALGPST